MWLEELVEAARFSFSRNPRMRRSIAAIDLHSGIGVGANFKRDTLEVDHDISKSVVC